jgi:hypothetical protein
MTTMMRQFILILGTILILTACGSQNIETPVQNEAPTVTTPAETETKPPAEAPAQEAETQETGTPSGELAQVNETYEIVDQTYILEALNTALTLPEVQGLTNSSLQENINTMIADAANEMTATLDGTNPVTITYDIGMQSSTIVSILFKAEMQIEDGTIEFWNPVSINLMTATRITSDNLFGGTSAAMTAFNQFFSAKALDAGFEFEAPEPWMSFYFSDHALIYFFKESDFSESYVQIQMPLDEIKAAMNPMFFQ